MAEVALEAPYEVAIQQVKHRPIQHQLEATFQPAVVAEVDRTLEAAILAEAEAAEAAADTKK